MKLKIIGCISILVAVLVFSCQSDDEITFNRYYSIGSVIYQNKCQNCHGKDGQGLSALMPPLTDAAYLSANKSTLACIVKYGLKSKIIFVNHKSYDADMPVQDIAPIEIAEVLTYVTNSFGNKTGLVSGQQVEGDLVKCK